MNYYKQNFFFSLLSILLLPFALFAQKPDRYTITGRVNGLQEGDKVVMKMMVYYPGEAIDIPKDSAVVKNGEFRIEGHVPEGPRIYWMWFTRLGKICRLLIDNNQDIRITYDQDISKVRHDVTDRIIRVEGSPSNHAFHLIWAIDDMVSQSASTVNHQLRDLTDSFGYDRTLVNALMIAKKGIREGLNLRFLYKLDPEFLPAAGLIAMYQGEDHDAAWSRVWDQMDEHLRSSVPGKMLEKRLPLLVGNKMPDFSLPDVQGKTVSLGDIYTKGKLTLVRFWATTSYKRPFFDTELKAMYKLYHDKGLNIIAVSSDTTLNAWKETLQTEQYPWQNVIDLKGKKVVDTVYHELGVLGKQNTTNILVDAYGKIVAWDVYGAELHWYLDSILDSDRKL